MVVNGRQCTGAQLLKALGRVAEYSRSGASLAMALPHVPPRCRKQIYGQLLPGDHPLRDRPRFDPSAMPKPAHHDRERDAAAAPFCPLTCRERSLFGNRHEHGPAAAAVACVGLSPPARPSR